MKSWIVLLAAAVLAIPIAIPVAAQNRGATRPKVDRPDGPVWQVIRKNCTQCHGSTTAPTFAIPAANFSIVTTPATHIPTTASCEVCHVGAGSSITTTPVGNGVFMLWSEDPRDWAPQNHSCDPNTAPRGLDLIALADIRRGEELTLDYATLRNPDAAPFACRCGAKNCRGTIRGSS